MTETTTPPSPAASAGLTELDRERRMGGLGTETTDREIRRISLADLDNRRDEIADQLWSAATDIGFFQVIDHGIDLAAVDHAFEMSARFFALPFDQGAVSAQEGPERGLGVPHPGTPVDRHTGPEGVLPVHPAPHGRTVAE